MLAFFDNFEGIKKFMGRLRVKKAIPSFLSALQLFDVLTKLLIDWNLLEKFPNWLNKSRTTSGEKSEKLFEILLVVCKEELGVSLFTVGRICKND